jgi:flagellar export protein FliJ
MRRFRFRLQRLEQLRDMEKREAALQLAVARTGAEEMRAHREEAERTLQESEKIWNGIGSGESSPREAAAFVDRSRRVTALAAQRERTAELAAEKKEEICVERARAHRILERLRERKWRFWLKDAEREEQAMLDELHLLQSANGRKAEES